MRSIAGHKGAGELDVVIRMDGRPGPGGPIKGLGDERQQCWLLDALKDQARDLAGRAMDAGAREVARPGEGARLHLGEVPEGLPTEEVLAGIGDPAFHFWFPRALTGTAGSTRKPRYCAYSRKTRLRPGV